MKRSSLHARSFKCIHFFVFRYRWTENGFTGPKSFRGFRETGPRPDGEFIRRICEKCWKFLPKQLTEICSNLRKWSKANVPLFPEIPQQFPCSLKVTLKYPLFPKSKWPCSLEREALNKSHLTCKCLRDCTDCFVVIFFSFFVNALQSDINSNRVYVLGHKCVLGPSQTHFSPCLAARDKMSLSRAQNIFMPANINFIDILLTLVVFFLLNWLISSIEYGSVPIIWQHVTALVLALKTYCEANTSIKILKLMVNGNIKPLSVCF